MGRKTGSCRWWLRTDKQLQNGKMPIHLVYSLHGQRKYYDTGIRVFPEQWNEAGIIYVLSAQLAKSLYKLKTYEIPIKKDIDKQNSLLQSIIDDIRDIETRYELDKTQYSSQMIINELTRIRPTTTKREKTKKQLEAEQAAQKAEELLYSVPPFI